MKDNIVRVKNLHETDVLTGKICSVIDFGHF